MSRMMWLRRRGWGLLLSVCPLVAKVLMEVPIWIALSSTVILYNSKSADGSTAEDAAETVRISVYESRVPICKSPTSQTLSIAD
jgi:hypothetical protein